MSDYEESSDEDLGLLKKALDVELPPNFNPNKVPETGEEYLQYVMYERKQCKSWIKADLDTSKFSSNQTFHVATDNVHLDPPKSFLPTYEWQLNQKQDFIKFRKFISLQVTCEPQKHVAKEDEQWINKIHQQQPKFSIITNLTQVSLINLLKIILEYMNTIEAGFSLEENVNLWLYAILATLEIPLCPDSFHYLRELCKKCALIRSKLSEEANESMYVPLNLYICIVGRVFEQLDLADN